MRTIIRSAFALLTLVSAAACQPVEDATLDSAELDTAALDEADNADLLNAGAELADELVPADDASDLDLLAPTSTCTISGSGDSGYQWGGDPSYYDFGRGTLSFSGSETGGSGSITVTGMLYGGTYTTSPNPLSMTGAIYVNGTYCGSVSTVDRDGTNTAKVTGSCTVRWTGSAVTVVMKDSSSGSRWEFTRGSTVNRFNLPVSGSASPVCGG